MEKQELIKLQDLSKEEFKLWQNKLLEILVYFKEFCESNDLKFFLSGGTLIGAARHKGFIPWDDDVDVVMPREDYEKLYELWPQKADTSRFQCLRTTADQCVKFPMTVIKSMTTTCIFDHSKDLDICQGMKIDVEHLDGVPDKPWRRRINGIYATLLGLFRAQRIPNQAKQYKRVISAIILGIIPSKKLRYKISVFCENKIKAYHFSDCECVRYLSMKPQKREWYDKTVYLDFEGYKMPVPAGYDELLTAWYGDYMSFPPEESRVPKSNNIVFWDLNTPYIKYRGDKYYKKA